jgi:hypothetical protein
MLFHPPCEDLHLCLHVRNAPELTAGRFPVHYAVQMPVNRTCIAEFNEHFSYSTDLLDPGRFAWIAGSCRTFSFSRTLTVSI